ncbi:MAG: hypothetical protein QOI11_871 [Candidatus Eremiobacteraeota bacterium]|jgi:hypothetical protein|nr:hypothetical protein [Candidatus Eremiobacteraeota bacterium]
MNTVTVKSETGSQDISHHNAVEFVDVSALQATNFCQLWPAGKAALNALKEKANQWMRALIDIIISAGDTVCG